VLQERASLRVCAGGTDASHALRHGGNLGRLGFDIHSFPPWDGRSPVSHPACDIPFPPSRTGIYRKLMISAHPSYQGVKRSESVWDPETYAHPRWRTRPTGRAVSKDFFFHCTAIVNTTNASFARANPFIWNMPDCYLHRIVLGLLPSRKQAPVSHVSLYRTKTLVTNLSV
jgi:hypothetical protein